MTDRVKMLIKELNITNMDKINSKIKEIKKDKYKEISFTINGVPLQAERSRRGRYGNFYVPNASKNKKFIRKQLKEQIDIEKFNLIEGNIKIYFKFYVEIPKNFSNTDKVLAEMKYIRPSTLPDIDNYMKTYMDALTETLWLDDGQVMTGFVSKYYSCEPRVEIKVKYCNTLHSSVLKTYAKNKKRK